MTEELKRIKQLMNSQDKGNFFLGWHMLKNYKKYGKGEFRDMFINMFLVSEIGNNFTYTMLLEEGSVYGFFHKYKYEKELVFSYKLNLQNHKEEHRKKIPIDSFSGQKRSVFNKIINFIELKYKLT